MAENIFPSAGRKYDACINQGASENFLFTTQKIDLYSNIYGMCHCVCVCVCVREREREHTI